MLDSKLYQMLVVGGAICAIIVGVAVPVGWLLGAFNAPLSMSMTQMNKDMSSLNDKMSKLSDTFAQMPGIRDWTSSNAAISANANAIGQDRERMTRDEIEWSRIGGIVDRLQDGTAATTHRSR